jgi:hypothetical protein
LISDTGMHVRFRGATTHLRGHDKGAKADDVLGKRRHGLCRTNTESYAAGESESSTRDGQVRTVSTCFDVCNTAPSAASAQTCFRSLKRRIPCTLPCIGAAGSWTREGARAVSAFLPSCHMGAARRGVSLHIHSRFAPGHSNTVGTHRGVARCTTALRRT